MRRYLNIVLFSSLVLFALPVLAGSSRTLATHEITHVPQTLLLPPHVVEVAPHVFSLGSAIDPSSGKQVEGFAFVYPREAFHHRPGHTGGPGGPGGGKAENKCYSTFAKGASWKSIESWLVNPANTSGLSSNFVLNNLTADIAEWEGAVDGGATILGNGSATNAILSADSNAPDGFNEVYFGSIADQGAIAVTIVWGVFGGPPTQRELIEWDMVFDQVDFAWANDGSAGAMDFENIAQHELGHALGLTHPDDSCTEETMFRLANNGETKKRDLNAGDIAGVNELY